MKMSSRFIRTRPVDNIAQMLKVPTNASSVDRWIRRANTKRKITFIPSSAGTTTAAFEANVSPFVIPMKRKAITMVDGSVPRIPPALVPYFSAITVMMITTIAERKKGIII